MFILKQFLKHLILPPTPWLLMLLAVLVFWRRAWARRLLLLTVVLIFGLHSGLINHGLRYLIESQYAPLIDPRKIAPYDAIVVLTGGITPASGLVPFPTINESMFRRLDEAWRRDGSRQRRGGRGGHAEQGGPVNELPAGDPAVPVMLQLFFDEILLHAVHGAPC
jgi:uncharacterized SAM-binding protein YcdF (DUF218 family)